MTNHQQEAIQELIDDAKRNGHTLKALIGVSRSGKSDTILVRRSDHTEDVWIASHRKIDDAKAQIDVLRTRFADEGVATPVVR